MNKVPQFLIAILVAIVGSVIAAPPGYTLARENGVTYLADILEPDQKVTLNVKTATTVFTSKDATEKLDVIGAGKKVDMEGFTEFALRVRGDGTHGRVVGWVNPKDVELPDPELMTKLKKMAERRIIVAELIAEKSVAIGMTYDEVNESKGMPTKRSSRVDAVGRTDILEYIDYEIIPRYEYLRDPVTGGTYRRFSHNEKIEKGKTSVEMVDGVVTAVGEMEDLSKRSDLRIVPVPIWIEW